MNYSKTSKLLKKFKGLHNTLKDSGQEPSGIEKDLLLSYLKELYEQVVTIEAVSAEPPIPKQQVAEVITASSNGNNQIYEAPKEVIASAPVLMPSAEKGLEEDPKEQIPAASTPVIPEPPRGVPSEANSPLAELFADKDINELSDKLNKLPISDINRAMGINEKVLTINELFHGNQELYSKTVLKLNSFSSYSDAKDYLIGGVASDLNWASESKVKKADKFIQLLRRRYS